MKREIKVIVIVFTLMGAITGIGVGAVLSFWMHDLPRVESLIYYQPSAVTQVYDIRNELIGEFFIERRLLLKRHEIPSSIINALLAAEDAGFYHHTGFDIPGILRAVYKNLKTFEVSQGASTITQQVSRMLFLSNERTFSRKIREALLTIRLERNYSKDEIVTMYLNHAYFGLGSYGVEAAARSYFGISASDLTVSQSALLASLLKNPAHFSPVNHPQRALKTRNHVLTRMQEAGFLTSDQLERYKAEPLGIRSRPGKVNKASYFLEEVRKQLMEKYGYDGVYRAGMSVYTTLDLNQQEAAENAVESGLMDYRMRHNNPEAKVQSALIALSVGDGAVRAMVGGENFAESKFNRSMQARRQPGSSIKPLVFLTGLLDGFPPNHIIVDAPVVFRDKHTGKVWRPQNYSGKYYGPVTMRYSLEHSLNVPTVKLLDDVGIDAFLQTARSAGIHSELPPYLSVGIGSGEVTLLELSNAYSTVAAGGIYSEPYIIDKVYNSDMELIEEHQVQRKAVFDRESCSQLTSILQGAVLRGTCWRARKTGRPIAAKTGTTDNNTDAWFIGYTPNLVAGIWVGYDLKESLGDFETGSRTAGPIFTDFMKTALAGLPPVEFDIPDSLVEQEVCYESGKIASDRCPEPITEYLKPEQIIQEKIPLGH